MATYNGSKHLKNQLDSILKQTYSHLEILVQDDGSTDDTFSILQEYATKDQRIRITKNRENLGLNDNFYSLIHQSNGEYIAISDQDDIWELDKIKLLLENIADSSLIYTDSDLIDNDGETFNISILQYFGHQPKIGKKLISLFEKNTVSGHACLFHHSLKNKIPKKTTDQIIHDNPKVIYDMVIAVIASFKNGISYYDKPLTLHRIHGLNNHNNIKEKLPSKSAKTKSNQKNLKHSKATKGKPHTQISFLKKKQNRIQTKIKEARQALERYPYIEATYNDIPNLTDDNSVTKFQHCLFNFGLYKDLLAKNYSKSEARNLSYGKWYYLLFKIF